MYRFVEKPTESVPSNLINAGLYILEPDVLNKLPEGYSRLEEDLFPSAMSMNTRDELEEERRLFYVALTRAEKQAYLTYALSRYRWG